jgi:predicted nucleotidyltransferase
LSGELPSEENSRKVAKIIFEFLYGKSEGSVKATGEFEKLSGLDRRLIDQILDVILKYTTPKKVIIFGSRARGDFKKTSDIDIAIDSEEDIDFVREILDEEVETLLKFDVVNLRKVNEDFKRRILEEGIVIYGEESGF